MENQHGLRVDSTRDNSNYNGSRVPALPETVLSGKMGVLVDESITEVNPGKGVTTYAALYEAIIGYSRRSGFWIREPGSSSRDRGGAYATIIRKLLHSRDGQSGDGRNVRSAGAGSAVGWSHVLHVPTTVSA